MTLKHMDREELEQRLVYALFGPAVQLATRFGMPLSWMKRSLETAYFHRARQEDMSLKDICALMDISISKAALLSKQLKQGFINEEEVEDINLEQRIEYMLCAGPLTLPRLNQVLPTERFRDIEEALDALIEVDKVERIIQSGMYTRYALRRRDKDNSWHGTIERLRHLQATLKPIMPSIYGHFIETTSSKQQHTHTTAQLTSEEFEQLRAKLDETLIEFLEQVEETRQEKGTRVTITTFWEHEG